MVPGTHCSATDITVANASKAPAAPIMWPVIDLVALIASDRDSRDARDPNVAQIASASRLSPSGVDVPCGLIRSTSSAGTPRRSRAIRMALADPMPRSIGWIMSPAAAGPAVCAVADAVPRLVGVILPPAGGGGAVADDLGVDPRPASLGQLQV